MLIAALLLIAPPDNAVEQARTAWRECAIRVTKAAAAQGAGDANAVMLGTAHCTREAARYVEVGGPTPTEALAEQTDVLQAAADALYASRRSAGARQ